MVDEVLAGEGVDDVTLTPQVCARDRNELPVARRDSHGRRLVQKLVAVGRRERRDDQVVNL